MSGSFTTTGGGETESTINQLTDFEDTELSNIVGSFEPQRASLMCPVFDHCVRKFTDTVVTGYKTTVDCLV